MGLFRRPIEKRHLTQTALSAYLDASVAPREQEAADQHLRLCSRCQGELQSLREVSSLLRALPVVPVPHSFALQYAVVDERRASWSPIFALRAAAAAAAVALAIVLIGDGVGLLGAESQPIPVQLGMAEPEAVVITDAVLRPEAAVPLPPSASEATQPMGGAAETALRTGGTPSIQQTAPLGALSPARFSLWPLELGLLGMAVLLLLASSLLPRWRRPS